MPWSRMSDTWLAELEGDPAYDSLVTPLLLAALSPQPGRRYLDLGCGEGRVMRALEKRGAIAHGIDLNVDLARRAGTALVARLPVIPIRRDAYDGVYSVLALEHIEDHPGLFEETARVTVPGGVMVIVMNHPYWTAPGSTPVTDTDGEVLWRPGEYLDGGSSSVPMGDDEVVFHHRSMSGLLNSAAEAGWSLEHMSEHAHHDIDEQSGIPRLLACRWRLLP